MDFLHDRARSLHRFLTDLLFPLPATLYLFPGVAGSAERCMVLHVMRQTGLSILHVEDDGTRAGPPLLWVEDATDGIRGTFALVRYVGRLWRLYPSDPAHALMVDSLLDSLASFMHSPDLTDAVTLLEARLRDYDDAAVLYGFEDPTVADYAWAAALAVHSVDKDAWYDPETVPHFHAWWVRIPKPPLP